MSNLNISNELKIYTVAEVAAIMGVTKGKVYEYIHEGKLPHVKLGSTKVMHNSLVAFLKAQETTTKWGEGAAGVA